MNPLAGGPMEGLTRLALAMAEQGHVNEILCLDSPADEWLQNSPLIVHAMGPTITRYGYTPRLIPWLRQHAAEYGAVVIRGVWQFHSFGTWLALRKTGIPYFIFLHGMLDPWFNRKYPFKHMKKWLYWPWAEYRVLRDARAVLFTSEEERRLSRQSFWLYRCREVVVNYGTVGPTGDRIAQQEAFLSRFPELRGKRLALHIGRIHHKKGCDLLIEGFAEVLASDPDWRLVFAGPDQIGWKNDLVRMASKLGIADRITWTGMVAGDLKWGAFYSAECFVLPSHSENFGIAVAEALASGLPVLISNKVNIWREIEQDGGGLVAPDTLAGTISLLQRWLALSAEEKSVMSMNAQACFFDKFEVRKTIAGFLDVWGGKTLPI